MSKALSGRGVRVLLIATALLAGAAGIALATIPGSGGVISGCYEKRTGILRVIDTQAGKTCLSFETPISWNQQGPKGDQGTAGPRGLQGERGPAGPASLNALDGTPCTIAGGDPGTVSVSVASDGSITLRCTAPNGGGGGGGGGTATTPLIVTPSVLDFGPVTVGAVSQPLQLTVRNPNAVAVGLSITAQSAQYSVASGCGSTLAANASCSVDVTFAPVQPGNVLANLAVSPEPESLGQAVVLLLGTGV